MSKVSVVLPVFNQEDHILESVNSILKQSFTDLRLIVINDGSTDGTIERLSTIDDKRMEVINNPGNKGLIYSLNKGFSLASQSKYIARMDSDDISLPNRFLKQVEFLDQHQDIGVLGAAMNVFGKDFKTRVNYRPHLHPQILSTFLTSNPISHPTVMLRSELISNSGYSVDFPKYEDYALWIELINKCKFHNLQDVLLNYRRHSSNITSTYKQDVESDFQIFRNMLLLYSEKLDIELSQHELDMLCTVTSRSRAKVRPNISNGDLHGLLSVFDKLAKTGADLDFGQLHLIGKIIIYLLENDRKLDVLKVLVSSGRMFDIIKIFKLQFFGR